MRPEQQIDGRGGEEVDGGCCEFSARSAQPESVVFFLPASRISSITPAVSSQSPSYMCAAAGLFTGRGKPPASSKGGWCRRGAGCPSNCAWATACMRRQRHLLLWCMFCGTAKAGASATPHKRRRPAVRHKQCSNFNSRQGQRSEELVILKEKSQQQKKQNRS